MNGLIHVSSCLFPPFIIPLKIERNSRDTQKMFTTYCLNYIIKCMNEDQSLIVLHSEQQSVLTQLLEITTVQKPRLNLLVTFVGIFFIYGGQFKDGFASCEELLFHIPISTSSSSSQLVWRLPVNGISSPHQLSCIDLGPGCEKNPTSQHFSSNWLPLTQRLAWRLLQDKKVLTNVKLL